MRFKKLTALLLSFALFLSVCGSGVLAADGEENYGEWDSEWDSTADNIQTGKCGDDINWRLNKSTGLLRISGSGEMWSRNDHESSFWSQSYVNSVEFSGNITSIGDNAFDHCNATQAITLPDTVESIGTEAFFYCSFQNISLPSSLKRIGSRAFFCNYFTELNLPQGLTTVESQAFFSSKKLTEVTVPKSVTSLAAKAFGDCQKLTRISVEKGSAAYSDDGGVLMNAARTELLACPAGRKEEYVVPDSVTAIHDSAFYTCYDLPGIILPKNLKTIGNSAFAYCHSVEVMEIPPSVTSVGSYAFNDCRLKALVMSPTLQSVGSKCFVNALIGHFYFRGSWEEWDAISDTSASMLRNTGAEYHFNYTDRILITEQPAGFSSTVGATLAFHVKAYGDDLKYQWYYKKKGAADWSIWNGHTTASTSARANISWDGMQLRCKITDGSGNTVYSDACKLSVSEIIHIIKQPRNVTASAGKTVTFSVEAEAVGDSRELSYQWYFKKKGAKAWSKWNSHTTATTTAIANESWNGMQVYCEIGDVLWGNYCPTQTATVTICQSPVITSQPADVEASAGDTVRFTVKAQGTGLTYQWYYKKKGAAVWSKWNGHTAATTSATVNDTWNGIQLYCVVKDAAGNTVDSDAATVTFKAVDLKIVSQPQSVTAREGDSVRFTVKAQGTGLTYQWYYKKKGAAVWSKWNGHTSATTTATVNATWNGIQLYCVVTDSAGNTVDSEAAEVTFE